MSAFYAAVAGVASGIMSAMGCGSGSILIIYLTIFANIEQPKAQGISLIFFVPTALIACLIYFKKRTIDYKCFFFCSIFGLIGAISGWYLSTILDSRILSKVFGVFLLIMGIAQLFDRKK